MSPTPAGQDLFGQLRSEAAEILAELAAPTDFVKRSALLTRLHRVLLWMDAAHLGRPIAYVAKPKSAEQP